MKLRAGRGLLAAALASIVLPVHGGAQRVSLTSCPAEEVTAPADSAAAPLALDTVYTIEVEERRWSLRDVSASTAAGVAGTENAPWHACAGAWVALGSADLAIRGAYGTVRVRASLEALRERLRTRVPRPDENPRREEL